MKKISYKDVRNLRRGTDNYEQYLFPFTELPVRIRVLTQDEILRSANKGRAKANEELTVPDAGEIQDFQIRELLYLACVSDIEDGEKEPFFDSPEDVGELTRDETQLLLEYYNEVQEKYAPLQELQSPADFEKLIEAVKKNSRIGMSLSSHTLRKLCLFLIGDGMTLLKDSGYGSTPVSPKKQTTKNEPQVGLKITP